MAFLSCFSLVGTGPQLASRFPKTPSVTKKKDSLSSMPLRYSVFFPLLYHTNKARQPPVPNPSASGAHGIHRYPCRPQRRSRERSDPLPQAPQSIFLLCEPCGVSTSLGCRFCCRQVPHQAALRPRGGARHLLRRPQEGRHDAPPEGREGEAEGAGQEVRAASSRPRFQTENALASTPHSPSSSLARAQAHARTMNFFPL